MQIVIYSGGVIAWFMSTIFTWLANAFGSLAKFACGLLFKMMDVFVDTDTNIIGSALHPLYVFSRDNLVPISLFILVTIFVWNIWKIMFGRFAYSEEDPIALTGRTVFFAILILSSVSIMKFYLGPNINDHLFFGTEKIKMNQIVVTDKDGKKEVKKEVKGFKGVIPIFIEEARANTKSINDAKTVYSENEQNNWDSIKKVADASGQGDAVDSAKESMNGTETSQADGEDDVSFVSDSANSLEDDSLDMGDAIFAALNVNSPIIMIAWLLVYIIVYVILLLIIVYNAVGICWKLIQRLTSLYFVVYMCPLALCCGAAKSTVQIFSSWLRMVIAYSITTVLTVGFMRVAQEVVYNSFTISGRTSNVFVTIFIYSIAIAFLNIIKQLEKYIDNLGFNAVGFPDRSMWENIIGAKALKVAESGIKKGLNKGSHKLIDFAKASPSDSKVKKSLTSNGVTGKGKLSLNQSSKIGAFTPSSIPTQYAKGSNTDGITLLNGKNSEKGFIPDVDGNGNYKDINGRALDPNSLEYFTNMDEKNIKLSDKNKRVGTYPGVKEEKGHLKEDSKGTYYMSKLGEKNNVAIPKGQLDTSVAYTKNGNIWKSGDGDVFYPTKDGSNLVNVGNKKRYSIADSNNGTPYNYVTTNGSDRMARWDVSNSTLKELDSAELQAKNLFGDGYSFVQNGDYLEPDKYSHDGLYNGIKKTLDDDGNEHRFYVQQSIIDDSNKDDIANSIKSNPKTNYLVRSNGRCVYEQIGRECSESTL